MADTSQRIEPLNAAEEAWVRDELANVRKLAAQHCPDIGDSVLDPAALDRVYAAARGSAPAGDAQYANRIINAIGIAFGQHLVDTLGFQWCAVSDAYGQDLAVVAMPETAKMLVFPPNLVAKRWEAGTTSFLGYIYFGIKEDFEKFRADWEKNGPQGQTASTGTGGLIGRVRRMFRR